MPVSRTSASEKRPQPLLQRRGASQGPPKPPVAVALADGPQMLILDGFPTTAQVRVLGPNTGTANRYALSTLRKQIQARVAVEVRLQRIRPVAPPVQVTLRYVFPDAGHRDVDNFAVVGKPAVDGLVKAGILAGDNGARMAERVEFVKRPHQRRLEIVLAPAAEPGPRGQ